MGSPSSSMARRSIMIDTKDAVRMGMVPISSARRAILGSRRGRGRGRFIGCSRPSVQTALDARRAGWPGYRSRASSRAASAVSVGMVSSSMIHTRSASQWLTARAMPAANPPAPPMFSGIVTTSSTTGWACAMDRESSVDALSMTTTVSGALVWDARPSSVWIIKS